MRSRWHVFACEPLSGEVIVERFVGSFDAYEKAIEYTRLVGRRFRVREEVGSVILGEDGLRDYSRSP